MPLLIFYPFARLEIPFNSFMGQGLEGMYNLAQKCVQMKPMSSPHKLLRLIIGIIGENTEVSYVDLKLLGCIVHCFTPYCFYSYKHLQVVLAECSRGFGPW